MVSAYAATLLVIDPDQALQADFRATFATDGHRTIPAAAIDDGIAALGAFSIDLILVDGSGIAAPGGWAALARLRAAAGTIPVVILSADGAVPFAGYRARGFAGLVPRRGDADDLSTTIAPLLAAARGPVPGAAVSA